MYDKILKLLSDPNAPSADGTEQRILDAALTEAAASGTHKLTMEAVALRAGLNRTTIYRRFGSMDTVLARLAIREGRAVTAAMREATAGVEVPDPHRRIGRCGDQAVFVEGCESPNRAGMSFQRPEAPL